MHFLIYVSSAVKPFTQNELVELLTKSRESNTKVGITGLLLYKNGNFMQLLEGEEETIQTLHKKIAEDERHKGLITLLQGPLQERGFPDWSMCFYDLASPDVHSIPGYNEFLNTPLTDESFSADPTRCQRLLRMFKQKAK